MDVGIEEGSNDDEVEEGIGDDLIPLVGVQFGQVAISDEDSEEFARAKYEATPWKFFSSQPNQSQLGEEVMLIQPSPILLSNP